MRDREKKLRLPARADPVPGGEVVSTGSTSVGCGRSPAYGPRLIAPFESAQDKRCSTGVAVHPLPARRTTAYTQCPLGAPRRARIARSARYQPRLAGPATRRSAGRPLAALVLDRSTIDLARTPVPCRIEDHPGHESDDGDRDERGDDKGDLDPVGVHGRTTTWRPHRYRSAAVWPISSTPEDSVRVVGAHVPAEIQRHLQPEMLGEVLTGSRAPQPRTLRRPGCPAYDSCLTRPGSAPHPSSCRPAAPG